MKHSHPIHIILITFDLMNDDLKLVLCNIFLMIVW